VSNRELEAVQEIADHRLGAITLLKKIDDFFWPPDLEQKEETALMVEVHRFLEGCTCPPSVPQHEVSCDAYGIGGSPRDKPCICGLRSQSETGGDENAK
jgi:hypothetical protein